MTEGVVVADVRLWERDLPHEFRDLIIGQKIKIKRGVFEGMVLRVVGKAVIKGTRFTYCNYV